MLTIDERNMRFLWNGQDLTFTVTEYRVMAAMAANPGEYVSYRKIYDIMKERENFVAGCGPDGYRTNVRSAIKRIRKKIMSIGGDPEVVINYQSFGYSLDPKFLPKKQCCPTCGQHMFVIIQVAPTPIVQVVEADEPARLVS